MPGVRGTWGRPSLCAALLLALAAMLVVSVGAAAKPKPKRCPPSKARTHIKGKLVCIAVGTKPKGSAESVGMGSALAAAKSVKVRYRRARPAVRKTLAKLRTQALASTGTKALGGALSVGYSALGTHPKAADGPPHIDQAGPTVNGWTTHVSGDGIPPADGDVGVGADVTATATKDFPGGTVTQSVREKWVLGVRNCPDVNGLVPGKVVHELGWHTEIAAKGRGRVVVNVQYQGDGAETGHVDDTGHMQDYDHAVHFTFLVQVSEFDAQGRNVTSNPPVLATANIQRHHIKPPIDYGDLMSQTVDANLSGMSALSHSDAVRFGTDAIHLFGFEFYFTGTKIEDEFHAAEEGGRGWQGGGCVKVSAKPDKAELKLRETTHVAVTVTPPPGEALAPGKLTASVDEGSISPGTASYKADGHVDLTYTAPSSGWSRGTSATISVKVSSREGSDDGSATVSAAQNGFLLRLTGDMTETFTPVRFDHGTGSASYDAGGQAAIANGSGSGALTWSGFSYSDQSVEEGCQDGKLMTANFTGTGTDPGTMRVLGLDVSSGDPVLHLQIADPVEHVRGDFQSGSSACGPFSNEYDFTNWAYLLERMVWDGPSGVTLDLDSSGDKLEAFFIGSWQRSGTGWVRDMTYTPSLSAGETGTAHVRLELTPQ